VQDSIARAQTQLQAARDAEEASIREAIGDLQAARAHAQGQALSQIDAQLADLQSKLNAAQQRVEAKQSALRQ